MIKMRSTFFEFIPIIIGSFLSQNIGIGDKKGAKIGKRLFHINYNYKFKHALRRHKDRKYTEKTGEGVEGFGIFFIFGQ